MNLLLLIYLLSVAVRVLCDSSMPLFIVPNWDNECLTSYLRLSNLIYDTRSTHPLNQYSKFMSEGRTLNLADYLDSECQGLTGNFPKSKTLPFTN